MSQVLHMPDRPLVIATHGYNTDGEYIRRLEGYFVNAGFKFQPFIYGKSLLTPLGNLIANRFRTKRVFNDLAQEVINSHAQRIILVGHSHGHRLNWGVQNLCDDKVELCIGINGALDRGTVFKTKVINCYHPDDWILKWLARFRPFSRWGDWGARPDMLADMNINLAHYYKNNPHSGFFEHDNLPRVMLRLMQSVSYVLSK